MSQYDWPSYRQFAEPGWIGELDASGRVKNGLLREFGRLSTLLSRGHYWPVSDEEPKPIPEHELAAIRHDVEQWHNPAAVAELLAGPRQYFLGERTSAAAIDAIRKLIAAREGAE